MQDGHLLQIPGCDPSCPLARFRELVAPVIPSNWKTECVAVTVVTRSMVITGLGIAVGILFIGLFAVRGVKQKKKKQKSEKKDRLEKKKER